VIVGLNENLACTNLSVASDASAALDGFADHFKAAFVCLMKAMLTCPSHETRQQIRYHLESVISRNTTMLVECLNDANPQIRFEALQLADWFRLDLPEARSARQRALLDPNPDVRAYATNSLLEKATPLYGSQVATLLVNRGDVNATNSEGQTALHTQMIGTADYEVAGRQAEAVRALLNALANPNARDNKGRTPVHLLLTQPWPWEGVSEKISLLIKSGADLSAKDDQGKAPLHYLAAMGQQSPMFFIDGIGDMFAAAKPDVNARDNDGNTPLHIAAKNGTKDVFDWLIQHGASLDATNNAGQTPRQLVTRPGSVKNNF
jgi:ankyrin repeat protein